MAEVRVSFEPEAKASYAQDFVDRCVRIVGAMDERVGPFSVIFRKVVHYEPTEINSLGASVAWRDAIVFASLHNPLDQESQEAGIVVVSEPYVVYFEPTDDDPVPEPVRELSVFLQKCLKSILKNDELRVRHARAALDILEPGHPPGLAQR